MKPPTSPAPTAPRARGVWLLLAATGAAILGAKLRLIALYGSDAPFGDQWFGEAGAVYLPFLRGQLRGSDLFAPHNEHRIVFTRLLDLALLALNRQWDCRLQLVADALVHTAAAVAFLAFALRTGGGSVARWTIAAAGVLLFSTSAAWENALWAFQSQFYFLLLFAVLHLVSSFAARPGSIAWWCGQAAGLACIFTLAGGWLSAAAAGATVCIRFLVTRERARTDLWLLVWNGALVALGLCMTVHVDAHDCLRPASAGAFLAALYRFLSWPMQRAWTGWAVWTPFAAFCVSNFRIRRCGPREATLLALGLFALAECLALAYARGAIFSRYLDVLALGVMVNVTCLWEVTVPLTRAAAKAGAVGLWLALIVGGVWSAEDTSYAVTLSHQDEINRAREHAVRAYVGAKDFAALRDGEGWTYPEAVAIQAVLDVPALQAVLPPSVRAPLKMTAMKSDGFSPLPMSRVSDGPGRDDLPAWRVAAESHDAAFLSEPMQTSWPIVTVYATGRIDAPSSTLGLKTQSGRTIAPMQDDAFVAEGHWKKINFNAPVGESFQLFARKADAHGWFAFSAPVETGRWGWLAAKAAAGWAGWLYAAIALAVASAARTYSKSEN